MLRIKNKFELTNKVALVTGASKGIGASIARGFAELGAQVVICSRSQDSIDQVAKSIQDDGFKCEAIQCHVGRDEERQALIKTIIDKYGTIDILVNNVGTNPYFGPLDKMSPEVYQKTMQINLESAMVMSNLVYPYMKNEGGSIIHISSIEGIHPTAMMGAYNMSKSAMIMLGQNQAAEWGKDKIRVNVVCPGLVRTKLSAALFANDSILKGIENRIPLNRAAEPDEMAGLVCFLASEAASYMTGSVIVNDGGLLLSPLF